MCFIFINLNTTLLFTGQCKPIPINPSCAYDKPPSAPVCWNYGTAAGDILAPSADDEEEIIMDLKTDVPLFTTLQKKIYVRVQRSICGRISH